MERAKRQVPVMNDASTPCSRCLTPVPADAPQGLCPKCLLQQVASPTVPGFETGSGSAAEATVADPPSLEEVAAAFPQLEVIGLIGRGGMGVVYKARQKSLGRWVALKLLAPHRAHDAAFAARFAHEARALAALSHPHIVTIHDSGQAAGFYYLLMEYVDGVNLRQLFQARRLTAKEALSIVPSLCDALQFAHDHGIVHRDIKPENLMLDQSGKVKIADFGIAKMLDSDPGPSDGIGAESAPAGTPGYMAPEQRNDRTGTTDHRADIYSLGVVLYEMLTGELPGERLQPPSRKVQIDVRLDAVVLRALEQTPALRYQTANELRTHLETVLTEPTAPSPGPQPEKAATQPTLPPRVTADHVAADHVAADARATTGSAWGAAGTASALANGSSRWGLVFGVGLPMVFLVGLLFSLRRSGAPMMWPVWVAVILGVAGGTAVAATILAMIRGRLRLAWPAIGRIGIALGLGFLVLCCGFWRGRSQQAELTRRAAIQAVEFVRASENGAVWTSAESSARKALTRFQSEHAERTLAGAEAEEWERLKAEVRTAASRAEEASETTVAAAKEKARITSGSGVATANLFRAVLPLVPLALVAMLGLVRYRTRTSSGAGEGGSGTKHLFGDRSLAVVGLGALLGGAGLGLIVDRTFAADPAGFESIFEPPSTPTVTMLGWTPAVLSNNVVMVDVATVVEKWASEARWEFSGPQLPAEVEGRITDVWETRPPGILRKPYPFAGNSGWTILTPGSRMTRLALVFPDADLAAESWRSLSSKPLEPTDRRKRMGGTFFHIFGPKGQEYRAGFRIRPMLHADMPEWVSVSRFGGWNETILTSTWNVQFHRSGRLRLSLGNEALAEAQLHPMPSRKLRGADLRLEILRQGTNRVRIVHHFSGASGSTERPGQYREIASEILRTAVDSAKAFRGEPIELCRIEGQPLVLSVSDLDPDALNPGGPSQVSGTWFSVGIGIVAVLALLALLVVGACFVAWAVWRRRKDSGSRVLVAVVIGIVTVLVVLILGAVGAGLLLLGAVSGSEVVPMAGWLA